VESTFGHPKGDPWGRFKLALFYMGARASKSVPRAAELFHLASEQVRTFNIISAVSTRKWRGAIAFASLIALFRRSAQNGQPDALKQLRRRWSEPLQAPAVRVDFRRLRSVWDKRQKLSRYELPGRQVLRKGVPEAAWKTLARPVQTTQRASM
jgi:hypothetical protein